MRVVLTGGGTGGHVYPALAIGQAIRNEWPRTEFVYVGTEEGLENRIVPNTGFSFRTINVIGWHRTFSLQALKAAWQVVVGLHQAENIIHDFQPHLVIGTGGYVCLPVVWSATLNKIPTIIHEQNALPGLANRFLSRRVNEIMLTFPEARHRFPRKIKGKVHHTGFPIRSEIMQTTRQDGYSYFNFSPGKPTLLCVGGSRGAHSINEAMFGVYRELVDKIQMIHITGPAEYEAYLKRLAATGIDLANCGNIIVRPYLNHMEFALACADLCIGRAGAAFISEITAKGLPGILVPYPYAAENHQEYNAMFLVNKGAAEMIRDNELNGKVLLQRVSALLFDERRRKIMSENSLKAGNPRAIEKIIEIIRTYMKS
ncbi:MAG: undecaprenyldiphospho-muramoylpentapeptide beta-N-acetylglucosaminyltransferase [Peptococcaceae bacterium]|jgi:UDP-N-acetylglucosamine--N-acetylmuramyl-(pentapeptide) pyrophosphoryl-undecaprenol N-acetylglucosamine transferase|nr:undecaprenyldiphospho-muramoylpentapeptide beta-N-acetylglucosaminyltransferase [Peptococcaceae bacterium]MDH7524356.1 undecaprenyldiphospho-muramoylpentapeptide beta-N-acetylglucosaminyltransferase [Peptococcaceae bacterium]